MQETDIHLHRQSDAISVCGVTAKPGNLSTQIVQVTCPACRNFGAYLHFLSALDAPATACGLATARSSLSFTREEAKTDCPNCIAVMTGGAGRGDFGDGEWHYLPGEQKIDARTTAAICGLKFDEALERTAFEGFTGDSEKVTCEACRRRTPRPGFGSYPVCLPFNRGGDGGLCGEKYEGQVFAWDEEKISCRGCYEKIRAGEGLNYVHYWSDGMTSGCGKPVTFEATKHVGRVTCPACREAIVNERYSDAPVTYLVRDEANAERVLVNQELLAVNGRLLSTHYREATDTTTPALCGTAYIAEVMSAYTDDMRRVDCEKCLQALAVVASLKFERTEEPTRVGERYEFVRHPSHYGGKDNPLEVIKIIEHYGLNFSLGSVVKYVLRLGNKPGENKVRDLGKAREYIDFEIARIQREEK